MDKAGDRHKLTYIYISITYVCWESLIHTNISNSNPTPEFILVSFPYLYSLSQITRSLGHIIRNISTYIIILLYVTNLLLLLSTPTPQVFFSFQ